MKKLIFRTRLSHIAYLLLVAVLFSCNNETQYDGLILTDLKTKRKYLLKYNAGDSYFIDEEVKQIFGKDTTIVFK